MVAVPIAAWLFCYFGVNSRLYWIRIAASVALAVAIAQIVVLQNRSQASSYFLAKHDLLVGIDLRPLRQFARIPQRYSISPRGVWRSYLPHRFSDTGHIQCGSIVYGTVCRQHVAGAVVYENPWPGGHSSGHRGRVGRGGGASFENAHLAGRGKRRVGEWCPARSVGARPQPVGRGRACPAWSQDPVASGALWARVSTQLSTVNKILISRDATACGRPRN